MEVPVARLGTRSVERMVPPDAGVTELRPADPVTGLPSRSELSLRTRAIVDASALADMGLRTFAASLVTSSMLPLALSPRRIRQERVALERLPRADAGRRRRAVVPRPDPDHEVRARRVSPVPLRGQPGRVELLSFESRFEAVQPGAAGRLREARSQPDRPGPALAPHRR